MSVLSPEIEAVARAQPHGVRGRVVSLRGLTVEAAGLPAPVGALAEILAVEGPCAAEVVSVSSSRTVLMPLGSVVGVRAGDPVEVRASRQRALVGDRMLGRVVNGLGEPIDGLGPITERRSRALDPEPVSPLGRPPIREALRTGVRAIDLMLPLGRGQRIGVFAGPGVGKSTLMADVARHSGADVSVIALIGERGREVREFIEDALGPEGRARSVVVVATGDESPPMRARAARFACCCAEHFRDAGRQVVLMMDSVTRFAHAQRQIGLSVGEPPATKGYTPSVFAQMARLLERAGRGEGGGSITGLYTILVEGDDLSEPISDAARGILDGHVVLSRRLAQRGHFPAVDVLASVSRVADAVIDSTHAGCRRRIGALLAKFAEIEELVQIGAYARGSDPEADAAIEFKPAIDELLRQGARDRRPFEQDRETLVKMALQSGEDAGRRGAGAGVARGGRR